MPSQYSGNAADISPPSALAILSTTDTTPVTIAFAAPHGLTTNDQVDVSEHIANTTANGIWPVAVIDATHISLVGSIASGGGAGGANGHVQPLTFGATYALPSDGDPFTASAINTAPSALGDRTAFLGVATGKFKLVSRTSSTTDVGGSISPPADWANHTVTAANTWQATTASFTVSDVVPGDVVVMTLASSLRNGGGGSDCTAGSKLYIAEVLPGGSTSYSGLTGSAQFNFAGSGLTNITPATLRGVHTVSNAGSLSVAVYVISNVNSVAVSLCGDATWVAEVWRPTHFPQ